MQAGQPRLDWDDEKSVFHWRRGLFGWLPLYRAAMVIACGCIEAKLTPWRLLEEVVKAGGGKRLLLRRDGESHSPETAFWIVGEALLRGVVKVRVCAFGGVDSFMDG